jgi:hypothetical protein
MDRRSSISTSVLFDVAGGLRTFITPGQTYDKHFTIMAMIDDGQNIMQAADMPTTCEGIDGYYRHHNGSNNFAGWIKIWTKYSIMGGRLGWTLTEFRKQVDAP